MVLTNFLSDDTENRNVLIPIHNARDSEAHHLNFHLPIISWHGEERPVKAPSFFIPSSSSTISLPPLFAKKMHLGENRKTLLPQIYQKINHDFLFSLRPEHHKRLAKQGVGTRFVLVNKNIPRSEPTAKTIMTAAGTNSTFTDIMSGTDGGGASDPTILEMVAVLEGLHVSAQVISDSTNAVRAGLLRPIDIINIASAVKEKQVRKFLNDQANMDRLDYRR